MLLGGGEVNGKRLLKTKTVKMMTTNRLTPAQRKIPVSPFPMPIPGIPAWNVQGFGLGLSMITDPTGYAARGTGIGSAGSLSWSGMFGGWWQADPVQDMVLLWLVQALPGFIAATIPGAPPAPPMISGAAMVPGSFAAVAFQKQIYAALSQ
jgi:CubicO group peptidase (beta-lactamase class C family)